MVSSASCGVSRSNLFITTQFVLVSYWIYFGSVGKYTALLVCGYGVKLIRLAALCNLKGLS